MMKAEAVTKRVSAVVVMELLNSLVRRIPQGLLLLFPLKVSVAN